MSIRTAILATAWVAMVAAAAPSASDTNSANQLTIALRQSRSALGASALLRGGVITTNDAATASGLIGTGSTAAEIGGTRMSERTSTPPIVVADGYDGSTFWNQDQSGLVWTDASVVGVSQEIDAAYAAGDALFVPGSAGARTTFAGVRLHGARRYIVVSVTPRGSSLPMHVWIDAATHLPARYVVDAGATTYETDVSEYRDVDGLRIPFRIATTTNDGTSSERRVTTARIVGDDAATLSKPTSNVDDFSMRDTSTTSVPFDLIDNHVYLDVRLNGSGPYRFVFDTGGSNTIDPAVARAIGAAPSGLARDSGTGAQTQSFSYASVRSVEIGNAVLRNQVFAVEPVRKGFGQAAGERVDGLIGFEVLARYVTTFDYADRALLLSMPGAKPSIAGQVLPFSFFGTIPEVACALDDISSTCTVDTGSAGVVSFFRPFIVARPSVVPALHSAVGANGFGVGGGHLGFLGRLRSLTIGDFELRDLVAGYPTAMQGVYATPFIAANLGGDLWRRFAVTFDYRAQTVTLRPNAAFDLSDAYDRSGLLLIDKNDRIFVYAVRAGTPAADAGLMPGDVITSIDGATPTSLEDVRDRLRGNPGSVMHFTIVGKTGFTRDVTLTLRDWI